MPSGRALVGGLLVAVSTIGIFAAYRAASTPTVTNWLIINSEVEAGATIRSENLAFAPMDIHRETRERAFTDPEEVIGRVAVVHLHKGELVQQSTIARGVDSVSPARRVGISLDPADALGGAVKVGDRVDVLSVPDDASAEVIVRGALIDDLADTAAESVGSTRAFSLILVVPDEPAAVKILDAQTSGHITLIAASTLTLEVPQ
jgi:Flp pilus assembly protein CpaB